MDRGRDIRDYELLASVRRRRNDSLQEQVRLARAEHEDSLTHRSACNVQWQASIQSHDDYAAQTQARTAAGQSVRLGDLDNARSHGLALQGKVDSTAESCRQAASSVDAALEKYRAANRQLASNEARVRSLADQADRWRRGALLEMEDREEDERNDAACVRR